MATYADIIFYSLVGGVVSLVGGVLLLSRKDSAQLLAHYATPFAAGALLAAVFLDLLPEGIEESSASTVLTYTLTGVVIFFFMERFLHWFHHHHEHRNGGGDPQKGLIIVGDTLHNALDGVAIAAAFLINIPTGIVTTLAVAAHEIPQEIGDFGLLLSKGMRRRNVLIVNIISALATVAAAVLTFSLGSEDQLPLGALLGLSAGFLLYVAMSDAIPSIHEQLGRRKRLFEWRALLLLVGILLVGLAIELSHSYISENGNAKNAAAPTMSTNAASDKELA